MRRIANPAAWAVVSLGLVLGCSRGGPETKATPTEPAAVPAPLASPAPLPRTPMALPPRPAGESRWQAVQELSMKEVTVDALARIGRDAVPALVEVLQDRDPGLRELAASALARVGPDAADAVSALVAALDDPEEGVRKNAIRALGQIGPAAAEAVPTLVDTLKRLELAAPKPR